jgi:hypothetical protein
MPPSESADSANRVLLCCTGIGRFLELFYACIVLLAVKDFWKSVLHRQIRLFEEG